MPLRLLRIFLAASAFGWGVCLVGVLASWPQVNSIAQGMGAKPIAYDPMLDYWLRMSCGAFTLVGLWYLMLALWPRKFAVAIPWFGWLMIVEGVLLLISGLRLGLGPFPFYGDVALNLVCGAGIVLSRPGGESVMVISADVHPCSIRQLACHPVQRGRTKAFIAPLRREFTDWPRICLKPLIYHG